MRFEVPLRKSNGDYLRATLLHDPPSLVAILTRRPRRISQELKAGFPAQFDEQYTRGRVLRDMKRRTVRLLQLVVAAASALVLCCFVTARLILANRIHHACEMLAMVQAIRIGDSEDSIRPLLKRFGGYRWERQLGALEDYNDELLVNPWRFPTFSGGESTPVGAALNARIRRAIGFRYWMVSCEIAVKEKLIVAVQADTFVEGSDRWLGTSWRLSEKPREYARDPKADYLVWPPQPDLDFVSTAILEMRDSSGDAWAFWVKPSSPTVERQVASRWNLSCLDSFRGCDNMCDLLPEARRFFAEHSDLAPRGGGWDKDSRSCRHNPLGAY